MELQNNYLSGQVPQQTSKTPSKLEQMNLADNRLSGPLPASIGNFSNLQILMLSGNRFTGEIPSQIGNPQLCGSYLNPCNYSSTSPLQFHDQNSSRSQVPGKFKASFCSWTFSMLFGICCFGNHQNPKDTKKFEFLEAHSIPEAGIRMRGNIGMRQGKQHHRERWSWHSLQRFNAKWRTSSSQEAVGNNQRLVS
ncbi:hypothetical protein OIU77_022725 [Salix suchowensis]|uniref:Uncharacterized protein n=1 Tax=Salix suchowensis TaxID=1278906 RepID=A0ABQ9C4L6_9ROSI|nr:hypothetical protein OIU77_022725 [Salix suchowensis]